MRVTPANNLRELRLLVEHDGGYRRLCKLAFAREGARGRGRKAKARLDAAEAKAKTRQRELAERAGLGEIDDAEHAQHSSASGAYTSRRGAAAKVLAALRA